jgi:hypothetical protein|tara:strand:+ start:2523 stop:2981 length:459 start_codon:yes stop_codon:yes gene_type:complete
MAGNLKQRLIKAGRDFNYAEGVKVLNNDTANALPAETILCGVGASGPFLKVGKTDADALATTRGRLLVAKHEIPAGGYGVALPWKIVTMDTSAGAVGDPVYVSLTAGELTLTVPSASGDVIREVGTVVVVGGATAGKVHFSGEGVQNLAVIP